MTQAMAELNSDHYLRCFFEPDDPLDSLLFLPDQSVTSWPLSAPWGYNEEKQTIEYLFSLMSPDSTGYLAFDAGDKTVYADEDSVLFRKPYTLTVPVSDPELNLPQEVTGEADFFLKRNSIGYWAIYRWEDLGGSLSSPSWTELKAWLY